MTTPCFGLSAPAALPPQLRQRASRVRHPRIAAAPVRRARASLKSASANGAVDPASKKHGTGGAIPRLPEPTASLKSASANGAVDPASEKHGTGGAIPRLPEPTVVEVEFAPGKTARFETGRVARQAAGSVVARVGDTVVFCTACAESAPSPTVDFLPLRVDYAEKFSATGRTSGSYMKREGRPSEREVLISRLIDRPLRPMFQEGYFTETQLLANVFSYDVEHPPDALAVCGAAAALHISHIPLVEPVAAVRIAYVDTAFVVEPSVAQTKLAASELVVAGTKGAILMVEGYCDFLTEEQIMEGMRIAHTAIGNLCRAIEELRVKTGEKEKELDGLRVVPAELTEKIIHLATDLDDALAVIGKKDRDRVVTEVKNRVFAQLEPSRQDTISDPDGSAEKLTLLKLAWKNFVSERMVTRILDDNIRPDGRDAFTVRPITIDPAPLPNAHGSVLFTRGETQTLAVATLGGDNMAQRFETLEGEDAARFYLQYSFPPSSVGEVGRVSAPGRREIGHGKLAERALLAAIPSKELFPYVLRVESNITESNGSSSMASVCGGCIALLEAGVPLKSSVAGIAMGLVVDKSSGHDLTTGEYRAVVLTDILGIEDALGSCDAKFAGNRDGLSALQLDVKLQGISMDLFSRILMQARAGRMHVLDCMDAVKAKPSPSLPESVPKVEVMNISPKRIGDVIGAGGKTIRSIIERCGGEGTMQIGIDNDGRVSISSASRDMIKKAMGMITGLSMTVDVGTKFKGKVTKVLPFGAYVEMVAGKEGWLHISELEDKRTNNVDDVCKVGDTVEVKVIEIGRNGQFKVSRKACLAGNTREQTQGTVNRKDRVQ
ncbi:unnamed protein product [Chondrus crispus]|uniref:polyribonucleotide nucleotidyltransferase n=1 Tax=Chondrus crispus TaxID=2769 RepID=R7QL61_CHOCR|nr:unnamed protein product [Chondrus crispus]CDF38226.1 unnamed protein product [Chondrus crispus]|eukprot:XP_005718111.1 unnamed protein product [Chondrus crispus]